MVVIYANRIIGYGQHPDPAKRFTIENVHHSYQDAVLANLASRGYNGYGLPL